MRARVCTARARGAHLLLFNVLDLNDNFSLSFCFSLRFFVYMLRKTANTRALHVVVNININITSLFLFLSRWTAAATFIILYARANDRSFHISAH